MSETSQLTTTEQVPSLTRPAGTQRCAMLFVWTTSTTCVHVLREGETAVVGRAKSADIVVDDVTLSRRHARFSFDGRHVQIEDLGARNKVRVRDVVVGQARLQHGDHVLLGDVVVGVRLQDAPAHDDQRKSHFAHQARSNSPIAPSADCITVVALAADQPEPTWQSPEMIALARAIPRIAALSVPALILGETGAGKESVARSLHAASPRAAGPLRVINCGAIPATLTESVLFGHVRGAFSGADQARAGLFESAEGGSVFLDEVGELSLSAQAALLRVLETRRVTRIGAHAEVEANVRVIAATHCDLAAMADAGSFRLDLLHRLNVVTLQVPPLRARRCELRQLVTHFLATAARELELPEVHVHPSFFEACERHEWPGNLRELRNVTLRAVALGDGRPLTAADFPHRRPQQDRLARETHANAQVVGGDIKEYLKRREQQAIRNALQTTGGNKARAAQLLGMPLRTFHRRAKELSQS